MTELRDAWRALRATPLVTAVAVLSLALGIGANTAMFSIVDALLLRALPVRHAERLTLLTDGERPHGWPNPVWEAVRERADLFDGAAAYGTSRFDLAVRGQEDPVDGLWASGRLFETLGVGAALGRVLGEADDRRGGGPEGPVAVISHAFWQRRFGGAPDVVGRTVTLDRVPVTIVGVTGPGFFGADVGRTFDVAVPLGAEPLLRGKESRLDRRSDWWLQIMIRLRPGQSAEQATATLRALQTRIADESRPANMRPDEAARFLDDPFTLRPAATGSSRLRARYERPLLTIAAVVGLVLLIACGNIANLLLARATARRHELSVRTALGASRWRLARLLLAEGVLLSAAGAALGVLLAVWGSRGLVAQLSTGANRVFLDVGVDWRMLAFTAAVAVSTALLFATVPALRAARAAPMEAMKAQGRSTASRRRVGLAGSLVMAQVALSMVLLTAALLFVRTFSTLVARDLGFQRERALVVGVDARRTGLEADGRGALYERVREAALAVPGVSHAALSVNTPVSGDTRNWDMAFPHLPSLPRSERIIMMNVVGPGWFAALGTPVVAGRDFDARDRLGAPRAVIVNRAFARKYYGGESPLGRLISEEPRPGPSRAPLEIVGVVGDAVYESAREAPPPTMYWAFAQQERPQSGATLTVRAAAGPPGALAHAVSAAVTGVHPDLALTVRPLSALVDDALVQERLVATLSGFFGALALLLSALGLYGITAYAVSQRRTELGIRLAVGASPNGVMRLVLGRSALLVGGGLAVGAAASWWLARFVDALVYGAPARDPATAAAAAAGLVTIGTLAAWLPARRVARLDPARVLRGDS